MPLKKQTLNKDKTLLRQQMPVTKDRNLKWSGQHLQSDTIIQRAKDCPISLNPHNLIQLQDAFGNRIVSQLIERTNRIPITSGSNQVAQSTLGKHRISGKSVDQRENSVIEDETHTSLPTSLMNGLEALSGRDLSEVYIHRNSVKPSQLNALAYTQGQNIYLGPGQEKHLPHEGWHVVQQMQGRVHPVSRLKDMSINDNLALEHEADVMGLRANEIAQSRQFPFYHQSTSSSQPRNQESFPIQMGGAIAGLAAAEVIGIIGIIAGVASAFGVPAATQNGKSGMGEPLMLSMDDKYAMSSTSIAQLENITRALFFVELDKISSSQGNEDNQEDLRSTAIGNVKQKIVTTLNSKIRFEELTAVANGSGGRTKQTPWGSARIRLQSGIISPTEFDPEVMKVAKEHNISVDPYRIHFVKSCVVDYGFKEGGLIIDDNIWVRGVNLNPRENEVNMLEIECMVAFDWDGDTTFYTWIDDTAIRPGHSIPSPTWVGESDPDD
ncbi:MAG: DUF4157 domain-containing protein [Caldilineaceae bacterium]